MHAIRQHVVVEFTYDVHFTEGLFEQGNDLLAQVIRSDGEKGPKKILVVVDSGVITHHRDLLKKIASYAGRYEEVLVFSGEPLIMPGGEVCKNTAGLIDQIHAAVHQRGICRHSYIMAIGGGAVLDLAGYAAATAHRGVRLIRIPTTVLAQNDSAVGVKSGINAFGKKNFLGSFAPPYAVLNDASFLTTLEDRDWRAGISEAVKVALIKDPAFFETLAESADGLSPSNRSARDMQVLIQRCAELHLDHIALSGDPFEMGSSRPLDFGHWAAHKLEQMTEYALKHGEAVAIGIALDSVYAHLSGMLGEVELNRILALFEKVGFDLYVPEMEDQQEQLFRGLTEFREHLGGELTIMLLEGIGKGVEVHSVDLSLYRQATALLRDRARTRTPRLSSVESVA